MPSRRMDGRYCLAVPWPGETSTRVWNGWSKTQKTGCSCTNHCSCNDMDTVLRVRVTYSHYWNNNLDQQTTFHFSTNAKVIFSKQAALNQTRKTLLCSRRYSNSLTIHDRTTPAGATPGGCKQFGIATRYQHTLPDQPLSAALTQ